MPTTAGGQTGRVLRRENVCPRHYRLHPSSLGWLLVARLWRESRRRARCCPVPQHGLTPVRWLDRTLALPALRMFDSSNLCGGIDGGRWMGASQNGLTSS